MRCNKLWTYGKIDLNQDESLYDFFVTGGHCTSAIEVRDIVDLSKAVAKFVQKFMNLKHADESQLVDVIIGNFHGQAVDSLKHNYAKFFVKDERREDEHSIVQTFEFANNDIGKKLRLTATKYDAGYAPYFSTKINNL